jgi:hypothetical protein
MGKVAEGEKKKKKKRKEKVFLYVLKILCWKSLKSKDVMKNLYALMEYLVWNIVFQNALFSLIWTFFLYSLLSYLNLSPITTGK